jgi:hypothetical protein
MRSAFPHLIVIPALIAFSVLLGSCGNASRKTGYIHGTAKVVSISGKLWASSLPHGEHGNYIMHIEFTSPEQLKGEKSIVCVEQRFDSLFKNEVINASDVVSFSIADSILTDNARPLQFSELTSVQVKIRKAEPKEHFQGTGQK